MSAVRDLQKEGCDERARHQSMPPTPPIDRSPHPVLALWPSHENRKIPLTGFQDTSISEALKTFIVNRCFARGVC